MKSRFKPEQLRQLVGKAKPLARFWPVLVIASVVWLLNGDSLSEHWATSFEPYVIGDDARQQVYPFARYANPDLFRHDYLGNYFLDMLPLGYRGLFTAAAKVGDIFVLSKALPYIALLVTAIGTGIGAAKLGGRWAALAAVVIVVGTPLVLHKGHGGIPRTFGFPFIALGAAALAAGRIRTLAVLVPLAASFYPVASVVLGSSLAAAALLLPSSDRGSAASWSWKKRLSIVGVTGFMTFLVILPPALNSSKYGQIITPEMLDEYREAGPHGRYQPKNHPPFKGFFEEVDRMWPKSITPKGEPYLEEVGEWLDEERDHRSSRRESLNDILGLIVLVGGFFLLRNRASARRLVLLMLVTFVAHLIARAVTPYFYLPSRYVFFTMPIVLAIWLPSAARELLLLVPHLRRGRAPDFCSLGVSLVLMALIGAPGRPEQGLKDPMTRAKAIERDEALYDVISALPPDVIIGGWPDSPLNNIPYLTGRTVYLNHELHQAFHAKFVRKMRKRFNRTIEAYYASSLEPLERLRDSGVTHLLVRRKDFRGKKAPRYFAPFNRRVKSARKKARAKGYEVLLQEEFASIHSNPRFFLLDLSNLRTLSEDEHEERLAEHRLPGFENSEGQDDADDELEENHQVEEDGVDEEHDAAETDGEADGSGSEDVEQDAEEEVADDEDE